MTNREEISQRIQAIPALPAAATRAIELTQDPNVSMTELVQVIEFDPGLTTNILRLANSASLGGRAPIDSLRDAIVRLGMRQVFQLLMTTAVAPVAKQPVKGYDLAPGALLSQAIAVAIGTEELARLLGRPAPESAFTAGLLHDLGKIVLGTFIEVEAAPILRLAEEKQISFDAAEREVLGLDHTEAGAQLLAAWNLPESIVEIVRWHHSPEQYRGNNTYALDLVHAADALVIESGIGTGIDGLDYRASQTTIERLELQPEITQRVLCEMLAGLDRLREVMSICGL